MATGTVPFRGESSGVIFKAILDGTPTQAMRLNPDVPPKLEEIINKCLEKDRNLRYQHASDVRTDLQRLKRDSDSGRISAAGSGTLAAPHGKVWKIAVSLLLIALFVVAGLHYRSHQQNKRLTDKDTIVLADFSNTTGDPVFDDTLKTALTVSLRQSPFLSVLSDNKVAQTLKLMTRRSDTNLTPDVARELCQRAGSKAYITGSIASLGSQYVLGLKAVNCRNGDTLAQEQVMAASKEKVLDTLGVATSKLRGELGESLASVQKLDVPLGQATTSSLEALQAYSLGDKAYDERSSSALPYHQRAIEFDPSFAVGYAAVGSDYFSMGETGRASEYYTKAFQLRERASEREKLGITASYYAYVTGELEKAANTYQEWIASYPRDDAAYNDLGAVRVDEGQYEKAAEAYRESIRLAPDNLFQYENLANALLALQQFDEARQTIQQAQGRKPDDFIARSALYALVCVRNDSSAMAEQQQWLAGKPEENQGLSLASDTEAYAGHLGKARELTKRSLDSAIRADSKEAGAIWLENSALREAAFGNMTQARQAAEEGLKLVPTSAGVEVEAALAFLRSRTTTRTQVAASSEVKDGGRYRIRIND
jgi:eukaryotic-like serine/threonine-protein kinase